MDVNATERRNITILLRWISGFVAWPSLTIGLAFLLIDASEHALHVVGLIPLGTAAIVVFFQSKRIATRFYPPLEVGE